MTRTTSVLAEIVASRRLQAEPVATDALVHLLARSPAGRQAMGTVLNQLRPGADCGSLTFRAQAIDAAQDGRPDLIGADTHGDRLVVEAKFDAELTTIQRSPAYLKRLTTTAPSALIFLVPEERIPAIWPEILTGPGGLDADHLDPNLTDPTQSRYVYQMHDGHTVATYSWERLLLVLQAAMEASAEEDNLEDLAQIRGLVSWRTRIGWTPLLPGDLPVRAGRQLAALIPTLGAAAEAYSVAKPTGGSGDFGTGRYVSTPGGARLWVGLWFTWWATHGISPLWIQVKTSTRLPVDAIASALTNAQVTCLPRPQDGDVLIPITLPTGAELPAISDTIANALRRVGQVVDGLAAANSGREPPAVAG